MPLPTPILDDRSYQQLYDELVGRIPVYTPEWTDHNASDPGITLIELFAFLGENLLFRFNQIPEATRLAFLRLLDIPLFPATAAHGLITLTTTSTSGELIDPGSEARAGEVPFETLEEINVLPLESAVLVKARTHAPATPDELEFVGLASRAIGGLKPGERWEYYEPARLQPPKPGAPPLDCRAAVDGAIWIAVLGTRFTDMRALGKRVLNVGFVPVDEGIVSMSEIKKPCPGTTQGQPAPAFLWQASTGKGGESGVRPEYLTLPVVADSTGGLTREGVIRLQLPDDISALGNPVAAEPERAGAGEFPPVIADEGEAARVLFWLRVSPLRADTSFGLVRWLGLNAVGVRQSRRASPEFVGTGDGQPHQQYRLVHRQVIPGTLRLEVEAAGAWQRWREVPDFDSSKRGDRVYTLDREAGVVRFGNFARGRPPQQAERIRAVEYRYGGGAEGNVPAGAISKLVQHAAKAENPLQTRGGYDGESIEEALERVPGEVRRRDRAVTSGDFRELALQTPGRMVGRAETVPLFHPPSGQFDAAGVVSLVVWPREDPKHPNAPRPNRALLRDVCQWLDARRLVTTELWVLPPTYRKIAVAVGLAVKPDFGVEAVRRWVELVVRQYLAPLPPYGPEGAGWPLARRVHGPELEAVVLQVEGVAFLEGDVRLAYWDGQRWVESTRDNPYIKLETLEVPELWEVTVVEGRPLEPGRAVGPVPVPAPPGTPGTPGTPGGGPPAAKDPSAPGSSVGAVPAVPGQPNQTVPVAVPLPIPRREC